MPPTGMQELLEGTMMKRGTGMFVGWKERLFLLTSKQLVYFEAGRLSVVKGTMTLRDVKVRRAYPQCVRMHFSLLMWFI